MQWHKFVFSKKTAHWLLRHSVFWAAWWIYFLLSHYLFQQPTPGGGKHGYVTVGSFIFIKTFLLLLIGALACYIFIYLILPQLIKGKRLKPAANVVMLAAFLFGLGYFVYWTIFPFVDSLTRHYKPQSYFTRFWPAVMLIFIVV